MKRIIALIFLVLILYLPVQTKAANEFSSSYDVLYSVSDDGITQVEEDIKLKNLTDKFFPSSFSLSLPGKGVSDLQARDAQGPLEVTSSEEGDNTKVVVKFTNQQIIGLNKEYSFSLRFKSTNIAKRLGKVVSVNVPKVSQSGQLDSFKVTLSVPTFFGDPDFIFPKPQGVNESGRRINFNFNGPVSQTGISAIFGQSLGFSFEANYHLKNNSIFPKLLKIPLPGSSQYQKSYISDIEPRPENTEPDSSGNIFAFYKVNPGEKKDVAVRGGIQTFLTSQRKVILGISEIQSYLGDTNFWSAGNPALRNKLNEILELQETKANIEKAREIDKYVSNFLQFDYSRLSNDDFKRFGSITALNNPEKALSAEFVDLEIALLRSAGIPSRQVIGFSLPSHGRPYSFYNNNLHTWVEIYDEQLGWVFADPAWENTTKGGQFFQFNDLNHLSLVISKGNDDFILPFKVDTGLLDGDLIEKKAAELDVKVDQKVLSGFPSKLKIRINNLGNVTFPESGLKIDSSKIFLENRGETPANTVLLATPEIPPFGNLEYEINLKTGAIWHSYQDIIQITFAGVTDTRVISVEPILSYKIFAIEIAGGLIIIGLFYTLILLLHHKSAKKH